MYIEEITNYLENFFKDLGFNITPRVVLSNRIELADLQCDDSFRLAKEYKKSPIEIGESIVNKIKEDDYHVNYFEKVEFVKPGFINMTLSSSFINKHITNILNDSNFGLKKLEDPKKVILDYGGPNMAKPLHVGHLRPAIIGESLKRILRFKGYDVIGDVHIGDAGLQVGQVIYAILEDFPNTDPKDIEIDIDYLNEAYPRMSKRSKEDEDILKKCQDITKELQHKNETYEILWKKIYDVSVEDINSLYNYLGVEFDLWGGEYETYEYMDELFEYLNKKDLIEESEGLQIINVAKEDDKKDMPPFILRRSDGAYIYSTTDFATIYDRVKKYDPDYIMYVVDIRQGLHFEQLFRASKLANFSDKVQFEHNSNGTINGPDNKPYKTRSGNTVKLLSLIEETKETFLNLREDNKDMDNKDIDIIVNSIIKYGELQNARDRNYIFDLEKFSSVIGKTGPYLLYTYLRLNKLVNNEYVQNKLTNNIYSNDEKLLKLKLLELPSVINKSVEDRMPNYVADYLYDLAVLSNTFYQNNNINSITDNDKLNDLTTLINLTTSIIKQLLNLLIIDIPEKM